MKQVRYNVWIKIEPVIIQDGEEVEWLEDLEWTWKDSARLTEDEVLQTCQSLGCDDLEALRKEMEISRIGEEYLEESNDEEHGQETRPTAFLL